jgi:hypothetical protein
MNTDYSPDQQPFEKKLALWKSRMPEELTDACIFVNDTLEMSMAIGKQQFGYKVSQDTAMGIYRSIINALETGNHGTSLIEEDGE